MAATLASCSQPTEREQGEDAASVVLWFAALALVPALLGTAGLVVRARRWGSERDLAAPVVAVLAGLTVVAVPVAALVFALDRRRRRGRPAGQWSDAAAALYVGIGITVSGLVAGALAGATTDPSDWFGVLVAVAPMVALVAVAAAEGGDPLGRGLAVVAATLAVVGVLASLLAMLGTLHWGTDSSADFRAGFSAAGGWLAVPVGALGWASGGAGLWYWVRAARARTG